MNKVVNGEIVEDDAVGEDDKAILADGDGGDAGDDVALVEPARDDFESDEAFSAAQSEFAESKPVELWQQTEEDPDGDVPVNTHIKMKQKLKGRLADKDDELEKLRQENAALKSNTVPAAKILKRPRNSDFDSDEEYDKALDQYETDVAQDNYNRIALSNRQKEQAAQQQTTRKESVDKHYDRAAKLIQDSGINPDIYKNADLKVRQAVDQIFPGKGDGTVDHLITLAGEGSEKVMYFLGNNKNALNEFKSLLTEDPTGLKAGIFIGEQKNRLTKPKKQTSRAPTPPRKLNGDGAAPVNGRKEKAAYDKAHKSGNLQAAYNAKKKARIGGVDVSKW